MTAFAPLCLAVLALLPGVDTGYTSVSLDAAGQLHIQQNSGPEITPPKSEDQVAFSRPAISADHITVGWLKLYPYPSPDGSRDAGEPISGALALFRNGHVIHEFTTEQVFYDWRFENGGKSLAYSTGPTHGGAAQCVLRSVETGKVMANWWVKQGKQPPVWARGLAGIRSTQPARIAQTASAGSTRRRDKRAGIHTPAARKSVRKPSCSKCRSLVRTWTKPSLRIASIEMQSVRLYPLSAAPRTAPCQRRSSRAYEEQR